MEKERLLQEIKENIGIIRNDLANMEKYANEITECIKEERFIPNDLNKKMISCLEFHEEKRKKCKDLYTLFAKSEMEFDTIAKLETDITRVEKNIATETIQNLVKPFYLMYSQDEKAQFLLDIEKAKLTNVIEKTDGDFEDIKLYKEFSDAILKLKELEDGELYACITKLMPAFGSDLVTHAFVLKDMYIETEVATEPECKNLNSEENIKEGFVQELNNNKTKEKKENDFESLLVRKEAIFPCDYDYGTFDIMRSPREDKKFGVKDFKNDLYNGSYTKLEKNILKMIAKYNWITETFIFQLNEDLPEQMVGIAFDHLLARGYLRRYTINNSEVFYCATEKCKKAFQSKDARSFLGIRGIENSCGLQSLEGPISDVITKLIYAKLLENISAYRKLDTFSIKTEMFGEAFLLKMHIKDPVAKVNYILAEAWRKKNECNDFGNKLDSYFACEEKTQKVIFASVDLEHALNFGEAVTERYSPLKKVVKYVYVLKENKFYSFDNSSEVLAEEIWREDEEETEIIEEYGITEEENSVDKVLEIQAKERDGTENRKHVNVEENIEEILKNTYKMIAEDKIYCATAYLKAYSEKNTVLYTLWNKLAYAINDPIRRCSYSSDKLFDVFFDEESIIHDYLLISATLRTFFYNHVEFDYSMKSFYEGNIKSLPIIKSSQNLSNALHKIVEFKNNQHKGMDVYADYRMKDSVLLETNINKVKNDAKKFYEDKIKGKASENASHKRFIETKKLIYSQENDIAVFLKSIYEHDVEMIPLMEDFLEETFIKNGTPIDVVNIDSNRIDDYIDEYWNKAIEKMRVARKSSDLMSSLRQNLFNAIYNAVSILCKWVSFNRRMGDSTTDTCFVQYKKVRNQLLSDISAAFDYFQRRSSTLDDVEEYAGSLILIKTLEELRSRVDGSFDENYNRYFYIDFLRTDYVLLNDEYLPVLDMKFEDIKSFSITDRILAHANSDLNTFEERISTIFNEYGDDFGSAKLIMNYLEENRNNFVGSELYDLHSSIEYGLRGAENCKQKFIENLELMQSYGQIDNSVENKKEKFLQIIIEAFEYAKETKNFGFFRKVVNAFESQIKEDAKSRQDSLVTELASFKKQLEESAEGKEKLDKLAKVQEMLELQNYTVAEDLLSRIKRDESDVDISILPKDYLADFIDRYDYFKTKVADISRSLGSVISNRIRNKDDKGGRRLVENWPDNNGVKPSADKLRNLLLCLGFNVGEIKEQVKIGKLDNYFVVLQKPSNGRKLNYKHPISAFGSKASVDGFRVVFMFGRTDPDRLIAAMKEIGNAKNTLVLLDYPLSLQDRRTLARKMKKETSGKVFGVIDRVLLIYLAENYNEEYVNQMLFSILMPFSYAQPYVWESASVMPPEIFMGRKDELEKIESPQGVNIVYGGRQLGKSALLRMAKNDIDGDENGNRAVLVDIKGLDYKRAAKKIGHALYDDRVLDKDPDTEDWDELSRIIQRRLKEDKNRISYLLLLIDEADAFIESCESVNYHPFDALKDVQSIGVDRFKFVIAGLRNIVRFKRETALGNNSVLTHLEATTVTPFKYTEARELLEIPLYYLGFRFSGDKEALISSIFANANYFPGLIQLYCAKLVEAMKKGDYAGYDEVNSPVYQVEKEHIKKVLAEEGFLQQIREKFEITLKLDEDNYYYLIALLLARLYHENGYNSGYKPDDIRDEGAFFEIYKIINLSIEKLTALMEEMCELNVLRKNLKEEYLFNRYNFFQMMGSKQEVDDKLEEYMGE